MVGLTLVSVDLSFAKSYINVHTTYWIGRDGTFLVLKIRRPFFSGGTFLHQLALAVKLFNLFEIAKKEHFLLLLNLNYIRGEIKFFFLGVLPNMHPQSDLVVIDFTRTLLNYT